MTIIKCPHCEKYITERTEVETIIPDNVNVEIFVLKCMYCKKVLGPIESQKALQTKK